MNLKKDDLILFLGDSITDAGRDRENTFDLGPGYPSMAAAALSVLRPDLSLRFLNRGIGGNKTNDVLERLEEDCIRLAPSMVSILLGINDVWHRINHAGNTDAEMETYYRQILTRIRNALGDIPLVIMEPFLTADKTVEIDRGEVDSIITIVRRLAEEFNAVFVPLDAPLEKAGEAFGAHALTKEGVHPTPQGHSIIAKHWLDAVLGM